MEKEQETGWSGGLPETLGLGTGQVGIREGPRPQRAGGPRRTPVL